MGTDTPNWKSVNEAIAREVLSYRTRRSDLIDRLAFALEESCTQFPIMEPGEELDDICPFTFFASFSRPTTDERRTRLVGLICRALRLETPAPASFDGYLTVEDYRARFFSHSKRNAPREIEALWNLYEAALDYAQALRGAGLDPAGGASKLLAEAGAAFADAYDGAGAARAAGFKLLPVALTWVAPREFAPLVSLLAADGATPAQGGQAACTAPRFGRDPRAPICGQDCVRALSEALGRGPGAPAGTTPSLPAGIKTVASGKPIVSDRAANDILDPYERAFTPERLLGSHPNIWEGVTWFQDNWDARADDFADMLERALSHHDSLLCMGYHYNPHKEALVFARTEPERTREAFENLFDLSQALEERLVRFGCTMSSMFERHRGDIASATPRCSAHGSYTAASTYLFLRYPGSCHLFSPTKLRVLDKATGCGLPYRLVKPECVSQYFDLCDALDEHLKSRGNLLGRVDGALGDVRGKTAGGAAGDDAQRHVLLDDIVRFACEADRARG